MMFGVWSFVKQTITTQMAKICRLKYVNHWADCTNPRLNKFPKYITTDDAHVSFLNVDKNRNSSIELSEFDSKESGRKKTYYLSVNWNVDIVFDDLGKRKLVYNCNIIDIYFNSNHYIFSWSALQNVVSYKYFVCGSFLSHAFRLNNGKKSSH